MPLVYLQISPSLLHKAFKAPQVLADQTTNIILSHPKQSDFDHSNTIKLLLPFLVLQINDHSLYVQNFTVLPKSSMTCFITNTFFLSFDLVISIIMVRVEQIEGNTHPKAPIKAL